MNNKNKKGVSAIVATVLLILITFLAIGVVVGVVMPMITQQLGKGKSCFELRDYVVVTDNIDYTCSNSTGTYLQIKRGMENMTIKGVIVSIHSGGESKRVELSDLPGPGETKTYDFSSQPNGEKVDLAIVSSDGSTCQSQSYNIPECW